MSFWPQDLLPSECPDARILTWGYDTIVTKGFRTAVDKTNIFAQGKNLLFAFGRQRRAKRPVIFVAHSLGGIVVKEVRTFKDCISGPKTAVLAWRWCGGCFNVGTGGGQNPRDGYDMTLVYADSLCRCLQFPTPRQTKT